VIGDVWNVPPFPVGRYPEVTAAEWLAVEPLVQRGYHFKCRSACEMARVPFGPGWANPVTAKLADELGAPVQQAVTVVRMRKRNEGGTDGQT
jgi:hypothetical protein